MVRRWIGFRGSSSATAVSGYEWLGAGSRSINYLTATELHLCLLLSFGKAQRMVRGL